MTLSRNQSRRLVLATTLSLLILGGVALLKPQWEAYSEKQAQLDAAVAALPPERPQGPSLSALKLRLDGLKESLLQRGATFPIAENVSLLLMQVEELATQEIAIESFAPTATQSVVLAQKAKAPMVPVEEQRIELVAKGDFTALHRLLGAIERYKHPLGVQAIELERLEPDETAPVAAGSEPVQPPVGPADPERLKLRMQLSAYLLTESLETSGLLGDPFLAALPEAQQGAGVKNPFRGLVSPPTPVPLPLGPMAVVPPREPLEGWKLEGVLFGPGHVAIVRNGELSLSLRVGDRLEDWTVNRIQPHAVHLNRGGATKTLALPSTF